MLSADLQLKTFGEGPENENVFECILHIVRENQLSGRLKLLKAVGLTKANTFPMEKRIYR